MKNRKNKKGFTIVELVIVIGVIGILSAILIPTFTNLTKKANDAALQSNLRNAYADYVARNAEGVQLVSQKNAVIADTETVDSDHSKYYTYNAEHNLYEEKAFTSGQVFTAVTTTTDGNKPFNENYYIFTLGA